MKPQNLHFALGLILALTVAAPSAFAEGYYRVEVLVFRHQYSEAEPVGVDAVRGFHDLLDAEDDNGPGTPAAVIQSGGTFDSIRRRLQRLDEYQPIALLVYEQNRIDYHPPVRLHNEEVIAEELHYPSTEIVLDLDAHNMFEPYVAPLYRLDGSVQLRRSRFLHIDLDLEYRVDDPAWTEAFPPLFFELPQEPLPEDPFRSGDGPRITVPIEDRSTPPGGSSDPFNAPGQGDLESDGGVILEEDTPEPFRVHRLLQSRQVRTDTIQYFDSAFLGALVRVTATESATAQETPAEEDQ